MSIQDFAQKRKVESQETRKITEHSVKKKSAPLVQGRDEKKATGQQAKRAHKKSPRKRGLSH